jgi:hypothetical protein
MLTSRHSIDDGCYACRDRLGQELTRLSGRRQSARCVFKQELLPEYVVFVETFNSRQLLLFMDGDPIAKQPRSLPDRYMAYNT